MFERVKSWLQIFKKPAVVKVPRAARYPKISARYKPVSPTLSAVESEAATSAKALEDMASMLAPKLASLSAPGNDAAAPVETAVIDAGTFETPAVIPVAAEPETVAEHEPVAPQKRHPGSPQRYATAKDRKTAWWQRHKAKVDAEKVAAAEAAKKIAVEKFIAEQDAGRITTPHSLIETMRLESEAALLRQRRVGEPVSEPTEQASEPALPSVEPVAEQTAEPAPVEETPLQKIQREYAAQRAAQHELDTRPVNWSEENRTDLPMRTPGRVRFLIPIEAAESLRRGLPPDRLTGASALTVARILNDRDRDAHGSTRVSVDPGAYLVRPGRSERQQIW